jgi:hypothetical protein
MIEPHHNRSISDQAALCAVVIVLAIVAAVSLLAGGR